MKKKKLIGIIGEQAGGKGAASDIIIKRYGGTRLTTSNILKRTLDSLHLPVSRENYINLALILKNGFKPSVLMDAMLKEVEKVDADLIIIDGIRMHGDKEVFIKEYGEDFHLIYVTADQELRFERSRGRGEKAGESQATFEDFAAKEAAATEASIAQIGKEADFIIENNGTYEELEERVLEVMNEI